MKKLTSILLILLSLLLVGCSNSSPKDVVNKFFNAVKTGDLKSAEQYCDYTITFGKSEYIDIESLYNSLATNIDFEILSQELNLDSASVIVRVTKVDYDKAYAKAKSLVDTSSLSEDEATKKITEKIITLSNEKNLDLKESQESIRLEKFNNNWFIVDEENFEKILFL